MKYIFAILGIVLSFYIIKYREYIGSSIGEMEWMRKIGGIYTIIVLVGILIFFWSVATLTSTTDMFLAPILFFITPMFRGTEGTPPPDIF